MKIITLLLASSLLLLAACSKESPSSMPASSKPAATTAVAGDVDHYTCMMHPSVKSQTPGNCPICSMSLTPVKKVAAPKTP